MTRVPTPVGGIPLAMDTVPSILFAVLFGLLSIAIVYRLSRKTARNALQIGTTVFAIERIVIYSLRAVQAQNPHRRTSTGLLTYMQLSFAQGFISMAQDLVPLYRCLLVNSTFANPSLNRIDRPRARFWFRRYSDITNLFYIAATVPSATSGGKYKHAFGNQPDADLLQRLRYAGDCVGLFLVFFMIASVLVAMRRVPDIDPRPCRRLITLCAVLSVVGIYRLVVMHNYIPELLYTGPGSLTSPWAKASFYLFHSLPELCCAATLNLTNTRVLFNTGPLGDWRGADKQGIPRRHRHDVDTAMKNDMPLATRDAEAMEPVESV